MVGSLRTSGWDIATRQQVHCDGGIQAEGYSDHILWKPVPGQGSGYIMFTDDVCVFFTTATVLYCDICFYLGIQCNTNVEFSRDVRFEMTTKP